MAILLNIGQPNNSIVTVGPGHIPNTTYDRSGPAPDASGLNKKLHNRFEYEGVDFTLFSSLLRGSTTSSEDMINNHAKGVRLTLDVTTIVGGNTLDVKLQGKDPTTGKYTDIAGATFSQKTGTGTDELVVYPGIAETANESVSDVIPSIWKAVATHAGTGVAEITYSLGGCYIK